MRAFIYVGGAIEPAHITEVPEPGDMTIAADGGWHNAARLSVVPATLLGDMDSVGTLPPAEEILQLPAEKDQTDTRLAVDLALSRGAKEMVIVGGLSGRLDHTLSNLAILEYLHKMGGRGIITDGFNRVRLLKNSGVLLPRTDFTYLSLITVGKVAKGVTVKGCKYPLENARLERHNQYAVSNEITGNCALVEVKKGALYIVESR